MELETLKKLTEEGEKEFEKAEGDNLDSSKLPPFVWIPDFISLAGSTMYERGDREPSDVDMIVRAEEDGDGFKIGLDAGLRLKIDRVMGDLLGCGSTSWTPAMTGPNWRYKPLWDLMLVPHEPDEIREINEKEFAERFYKSPLKFDQCMECKKPPKFEVLWAEGRAHAWFCRKHTLEFIRQKITEKFREERQKVDIVWVKGCEGKAHKNPIENKNSDVQEALTEEIEKQFQRDAIEKVHRETLKNPRANWRELLSDLRYLGNSAWPFLEDHDKWGTWTKEDVLKHFARIVDALRRLYFPIAPPKIGDKKFATSYWKCYREAAKYMETKAPKDDEIKLWDKKREEVLRKFEKFVKIFDVSKKADEHIVCGVVYSPDEEDAQGDQASAEEIRKAAYDFMENVQRFGTNHVRDSIKWAFGKKPLARVLENYIAPCDLTIEGERVRKGSWVLITRILSRELWSKIKTGEITGYSMAGKATV